ncbi:MAG: anaerobic sulfatase maturase [Rhodospirillales bacterium]|nr:anaerobic sulfatase maturase [Rhodospirillales bacterium]
MDTDATRAPIHVLAKPTGAICNLSCSYCFFLDKELFYSGSHFRMSDQVLEDYIRQLSEFHCSGTVTVAWQGGEPTLMGLDFFRRAITYQNKYRRPGMTFENTMQTNGTLIDEEWCTFWRANNFLVGISIDGPRAIHDTYRVDKSGRPTFDNVIRGVRLLQRHGVDYNVLTAVNRLNADHPLEVYRFLRDEIGATWIQLIPVVERLDEEGRALFQQGTRISDRSVRPEQFGRFLIAIFDEWVRKDVGTIFVQTFEAAAMNWADLGAGMCVFSPTCGRGFALEHNGDLYSCDHFVEPAYLLGNLEQSHMIDLAGSEQQRKFGRNKLDSLPQYCRECEVRFACHGECPKNRFISTPAQEPGLNYLCAGYKVFFHHIDRPLKIIANLLRRGRPAYEVMPIVAVEDSKLAAVVARAGRNEPCPCGSGFKVKKCHGRIEAAKVVRVSGGRAPRFPAKKKHV